MPKRQQSEDFRARPLAQLQNPGRYWAEPVAHLTTVPCSSLLEIVSLAKEGAFSSGASGTISLVHLGIGAAVAYTVGLVSLWLLVRWLERGRFQYFAGWCIPVGIGVIIWQLVK